MSTPWSTGRGVPWHSSPGQKKNFVGLKVDHGYAPRPWETANKVLVVAQAQWAGGGLTAQGPMCHCSHMLPYSEFLGSNRVCGECSVLMWRCVVRCRLRLPQRRWYSPLLETIEDQLLRVAIIGRPNVGKSTLFNSLTGSYQAIVNPTPGVTRDTREARAHLLDLKFTIIDTPGIETNDEALVAQAKAAARTADVALFLVDSKEGVTEEDVVLSRWIKREKVPAALIINKCDNMEGGITMKDHRRLKLPSGWRISAAGKLGFEGIFRVLSAIEAARQRRQAALAGECRAEQPHNSSAVPDGGAMAALQQKVDMALLRIAIVGRPNVGKSTLFNKLLGAPKSVVSDVPGTTRDSVELRCMYGDTKVLLADTAGMMRAKHRRRGGKQKGRSSIEEESHQAVMRTIRYANVVVLVVDAQLPLTKYDRMIVAHVVKEGRCLVLAANKWDAVEDSTDYELLMQQLRQRLATLHEVAGIQCVGISAHTGKNLPLLLDKVTEAHAKWNTFVPGTRVQAFLERLLVTASPGRFTSVISGIEQVCVHIHLLIFLCIARGGPPLSFRRPSPLRKLRPTCGISNWQYLLGTVLRAPSIRLPYA